MSLTKLYIQNFQAHSKLKVEFDEHITTIVGSSDKGKSSVIRALRWICTNSPQGEAFIKDGTNGTSVRLFFDDHVIKRKRGKGQNTYFLDKQEFKAFGQDVPDTIKNILNINDVTWSLQHDSPFWFSLSAGEVSRQLNDIVDLSIIDKSLSAIGKKSRAITQTITICKERWNAAKEKKAKIDWVMKADSEYTLVEKQKEKYEKLHYEAVDLTNLISQLSTSTKTIDRASSLAGAIKSVGRLGQICLNRSKNKSNLSALVKTIKNQKDVVDQGSPDASKLIAAYEKSDKISDKAWDLKTNHLDKIRDTFKTLIPLNKVAFHAENDLHNATEGQCPVCGKEME